MFFELILTIQVFKNGSVEHYAAYAFKTSPIWYADLVQNINKSAFAYTMVLCVLQIAIREAGGIDVILLASKNHVANVNVQDAVCGVLRNLSTTASNRVSL